jgi:Family of unknown function (DUF6220)
MNLRPPDRLWEMAPIPSIASAMTDERRSRPARAALALPQRVIASLTALLVVAQFFLAGAGAFGATSFDAHQTLGSVAVLVALVGLVLALVTRRLLGHTAAVFGLLVLQAVLGTLGGDEPWIGAFHGLNAVAVMASAGSLAQANWAEVRGRAAAA